MCLFTITFLQNACLHINFVNISTYYIVLIHEYSHWYIHVLLSASVSCDLSSFTNLHTITLQNPSIRCVGNPQLICGIVKGYTWNHQRVSEDLL